MECKHGYFQYIEGELRCTQCGKTADEIKGKVEDKIGPRPEIKRVVPRGTTKIGNRR